MQLLCLWLTFPDYVIVLDTFYLFSMEQPCLVMLLCLATLPTLLIMYTINLLFLEPRKKVLQLAKYN